MARQRMHKPELITHGGFTECSVSSQLLLILLQNFCDDGGNHVADIRSIKAEVFPASDFDKSDVERMIFELIKNDLLCEYVVDNKHYYHIIGWEIIGHPCYQTINRPQPLICPKFDHSLINHGVFSEDSRAIEDKIIEVNIKKKENKTKEKKVNPQVLEIFEHWQKIMNHPKAKLDQPRIRKITQALSHYSLEDLKKAIEGCSKSSFHQGQNETGEVYDDIEFILRNNKNIEKFIIFFDNPPIAKKIKNKSSTDFSESEFYINEEKGNDHVNSQSNS